MRDDQVIRLIHASVGKMYQAGARENMAVLSIVIENKTLLEVVMKHIIPYRGRVLKIVFLLIFNPLGAQNYIKGLYEEQIKILNTLNKKIYTDKKKEV